MIHVIRMSTKKNKAPKNPRPTQAFSDAQRYGLWMAHDCRCFYAFGPLDSVLPFKEMEIDHIVPLSWEVLPDEERDAKLAEFGLENPYDFRHNSNLVPSCHTCNNMKRANAFSAAFLQISKLRAKQRMKDIKRYMNEWNALTTLPLICQAAAAAISTGKVTKEQIFEELAKLGITKFTLATDVNGVTIETDRDKREALSILPGLHLRERATDFKITREVVIGILHDVMIGSVSAALTNEPGYYVLYAGAMKICFRVADERSECADIAEKQIYITTAYRMHGRELAYALTAPGFHRDLRDV